MANICLPARPVPFMNIGEKDMHLIRGNYMLDFRLGRSHGIDKVTYFTIEGGGRYGSKLSIRKNKGDLNKKINKKKSMKIFLGNLRKHTLWGWEVVVGVLGYFIYIALSRYQFSELDLHIFIQLRTKSLLRERDKRLLRFFMVWPRVSVWVIGSNSKG